MRLLLVFFVLVSFSAKSQIDTLFWFAAPEVVNTHSDRPVRLIISSFSEGCEVKVDMPSNPDFIPIEVSMGANSSSIIDLTDQIDLIENGGYNTVTNSGLRIQSTHLISTYYEVLGTKLLTWLPGQQYGVTNTDIFTLKGANALGLEFYLPFQTRFDNEANNLRDSAWAAVEILATEDNTVIEVFPTQDFMGHTSSFSINLNQGEVYTIRADTVLGALKPIGTRVVSNKPISITLNDDSVLHPDGGWDLLGDQLIPVSKLGYEYILRTGNAYVIATENNSEISLAGVLDTVLNIGGYYEIEITDSAKYLSSSEPISVFLVTALGGEVGAAVLPQINCTGSNSIRFTRSTDEPFFLDLIAKSGSEGDFVINGMSGVVSDADFNVVAGTNGEWLFATIDYSDQSIIVTGNPTTIINEKSPFHAGIINGQAGVTGARYGYFSNFGSFDLGEDIEVCGDEVLTLSAGLGRDFYNWSLNGVSFSDEEIIIVTESGRYRVNASEGVNCQIKDSIEVSFYEQPEVILEYEDEFCEGDSLLVKATAGFEDYAWYLLDVSDSLIFLKTAGSFQVVITDINGCKDSATAIVTMTTLPIVNFLDSIEICGEESVVLNGETGIDAFLWNTGSTEDSIVVTQSGTYKLTATNGLDCNAVDSVQVTFHDLPEVSLVYEDKFCEGDSTVISATNGLSNYLWNTSSGSDSLLSLTVGGEYQVIVTDSNSCQVTSDLVTIIMTPLPKVQLGDDTQMLCAGESRSFSLDPQFEYIWEDASTSSTRMISEEGRYSVEAFNECGLVEDQVFFNTWDIDYPNVITPNGDGKNEAFVVSGISFGTWSLVINNRHGKIVYQTDDYQNDYIPESLSDGIYYFILSQGAECNTFKGWIQIVR